MFTRLAAALVAAFLAFTTLPATGAGVAPQDVRMPELRGFVREGSVVRPDPSAGVQTRYRSRTHEELTTDVFVYDGGSFADHESAAKIYVARMHEDVEAARRGGIYRSVTFLDEAVRTYEGPLGKQAGAWVRMRTVSPHSGERVSHAHLFYVAPYTIKFRSSFPAKGNTSFDDEIERFVTSFMAEMELPKPKKRGWWAAP